MQNLLKYFVNFTMVEKHHQRKSFMSHSSNFTRLCSSWKFVNFQPTSAPCCKLQKCFGLNSKCRRGEVKKKKVEEKMLKKVSLHKFSMVDAGCLVKIFQCDSRAGRIFNRFRVNVTWSTACSGK